MRSARFICALLALQTSASAQSGTGAQPPVPNIRVLADSVAKRGTSFAKTQRLVHWVNDSFKWSYTDYQRRTPEEIVARRAGNCAELASVLHMLLDSLGVRSRWIREINVQPEQTPRRQQTAAEMVVSRGKQYSVFGLQHNDHVWLEVWDDSSQSWFPADPAYGVVGLAEWLPARLALSDRPKPRVAAVVPIAADMLAPFVVMASEKRGGPYSTDRTAYYLIDGFGQRLYGGGLTQLPSWPQWVSAVQSMSPHASAAFAGAEDLHAYTDEIARLKATYNALARDAVARGLK
ncbi:MAG: transglutaminase-like domain-containing protein, partial [Gemmatimonadaceae bacterium]